jgi:hypothetical protein
MRSTKMLLILSSFLAINSQASDTFELDLPDAVTQPSSSGYVNAYENEKGPKAAPKVVTTFEEPPVSPHHIPDEPQGGYASAFTSYKSTKSSGDLQEESKDKWQRGLEKQDKADSLDYEPLAEAPIEDNRYFAATKSVNTYVPTSKNLKKPMKGTHAVTQRAPASESVPLPEGVDLSKELEQIDQPVESASAPVSAKDRKAMVMSTISRNYRDLKNCYNDGVKKNSEMKGKVTMGWAMDAQGRVSGVEVLTSQLNNKQVEKCMVDRLSSWTFPRQAKLQGSKDRMNYTFQFVSEKE